MKRAKVRIPTDEEEAAIQRGIALDPDNPEWTDEDFKNARPASEAMPRELYDALVERSKRRRGKQVAPVKEQIALRLDQDVLERWRATGPGWQSRMGEVLRKAVEAAE